MSMRGSLSSTELQSERTLWQKKLWLMIEWWHFRYSNIIIIIDLGHSWVGTVLKFGRRILPWSRLLCAGLWYNKPQVVRLTWLLEGWIFDARSTERPRSFPICCSRQQSWQNIGETSTISIRTIHRCKIQKRNNGASNTATLDISKPQQKSQHVWNKPS
jgi:hypothetical protein